MVFVAPPDPTKDYIKRVIGVPGDTVSIKDGSVYLNGKLLDESAYLKSDVKTYEGAFLKEGKRKFPLINILFWEITVLRAPIPENGDLSQKMKLSENLYLFIGRWTNEVSQKSLLSSFTKKIINFFNFRSGYVHVSFNNQNDFSLRSCLGN